MTTTDGPRLTALLMASGGLKVRDIAQAMRVTDKQVEQWLKQSSRTRNEKPDTR